MIRFRIDMLTLSMKSVVCSWMIFLSILQAAGDQSATAAAQTQLAISLGDVPAWWNPVLPEDVRQQIRSKA